jgi:hypothetical protein
LLHCPRPRFDRIEQTFARMFQTFCH